MVMDRGIYGGKQVELAICACHEMSNLAIQSAEELEIQQTPNT